ncbi:hypothetical protein V2J09_017961 [Rumex salicifolius]
METGHKQIAEIGREIKPGEEVVAITFRQGRAEEKEGEAAFPVLCIFALAKGVEDDIAIKH